jgi:hypothetical protein
VPYQRVWPGTRSSQSADEKLHPRPIEFTSPLFFNRVRLEDYSRVAFEADLPRIELNTDPPCNRNTGENCVNPPALPGTRLPAVPSVQNFRRILSANPCNAQSAQSFTSVGGPS